MSRRALVRAVGALGALLVLWVAFTLLRGRLSQPSEQLRFPAVAPADVAEVEIAGPADTVRLARSADGWRVNGGAADPVEVRKLLDALGDTAVTGELVARNPASHARMGVDSAGRRVVVRGADGVLLDAVFGVGGGYQGVYVRVAAADEVYRMRGALGGLVTRAADSWRDRRIASILADSIGGVVIRRGGAETALARDGEVWTVAGTPADTAAVRRLLGALGEITAIGFATPAEAESLDFGRPDRRLTVLSRGADTLLDLLVDSTEAGFRVRRSGRADVFQLDFWRVNELTPPVETLRPSGS